MVLTGGGGNEVVMIALVSIVRQRIQNKSIDVRRKWRVDE